MVKSHKHYSSTKRNSLKRFTSVLFTGHIDAIYHDQINALRIDTKTIFIIKPLSSFFS